MFVARIFSDIVSMKALNFEFHIFEKSQALLSCNFVLLSKAPLEERMDLASEEVD